jgi:GT2 family glycosyltransferase
MVKTPFVSVIIPSCHDWVRLSLCFGALAKQTFPKVCFEIIVVNNDPDDSIPPGFWVPDNAIILNESKPGSYAARNKAISVAKGDIFAFTDADCLPQEDWLESAVRCLENNKEASRVGGKICLIMPKTKHSFAEIYEKVFAFRQEEFVRKQGMAATANMIAKKTVFEKIGLFDESLMSGGDAEWGIRANSQGSLIIYAETCVIWHPTRTRFSGLIQKAKREAGGSFMLRKRDKFIKKMFDISLGFLPPVRSIKRVTFDKSLSVSEKIIAICLRYLLRIIAHLEQGKLLFSLKRAERF